MSQENVEVVRKVYEAWLRGDLGLEHMDAEMSMFESTSIPGAASSVGIEAVQRYMESFPRYWEAIRFEPSEYIDAGSRVVVVAQLVGRAKQSGVPVEREWAYVWTLRDGKAVRMEGYPDRSAALAAAGST